MTSYQLLGCVPALGSVHTCHLYLHVFREVHVWAFQQLHMFLKASDIHSIKLLETFFRNHGSKKDQNPVPELLDLVCE